MEWLRKNGAIALGVGLPLLLIVFFALATWVPKLLVEPPKHDVIFLYDHHYGDDRGLQVKVKEGHAEFVHLGPSYGQWPKLYRFSPATGAVKEIPIDRPVELPVRDYNKNQATPEERAAVTRIPVPEVESLKLDSSSIAPDRYEFRFNDRYRGGLFGGLFYGSYSHGASVAKSGNVIPIPRINDYYYKPELVGWVIQ